MLGFDTETTAPKRGGAFSPHEARMIGYSLSLQAGTGVYVEATHVTLGLARLLRDPTYPVVCHNAKFELNVLAKQGVVMRGFEDTQVAAYLLGEQSTGLKDLAHQHLGVEPLRYEQVVGRSDDLRGVPVEQVVQYAAADADHTRRLWTEVVERRLKEEGLERVYREVELPVVPVLARAERVGVGFDRRQALVLEQELRGRLAETGENVKAATGVDNPASHEQLGRWVKMQGWPIYARTEVKGLPRTTEEDWEKWRQYNPVLVEQVLAYTSYQKMLGFVTGLLKFDDGGRLHPQFNQAGYHNEEGSGEGTAPRTGRLSCSKPNLQQTPHHKNEEWGQRIRSVIVAGEGKVLVVADVAQEEPRIVAVMARDETLLGAFREKRDIYRSITETLYPSSVHSSLSDGEWKRRFDHQRFVGKTFFLAWYYGAGAEKVRELDPSFTLQQARVAVKRLEGEHPARAQYLREVREEAERSGAITTLYGRKVWAPEAWAKEKRIVESGLRKWANAVIQGTGADILKMALVKVDRELDRKGMESRLVLFVHDEVVLECPLSEVRTVGQMLYNAFQGYLGGEMELPVEVSVGRSWGETRPLVVDG